MDPFWREYLERYVNQPFYWWQPKGLAINPSNLRTIRRKLAVLKEFEGKHWRKQQRAYAKKLQEAGLYNPTRATRRSADYAAIVRMREVGVDAPVAHLVGVGQGVA